MNVAPALLEDWLRDRYFTAEIDIGCSGVENFSFADIRELAGISQEDLDQIVFRDSRSLGSPGIREAIARRWGDGNPERVMATHGSSEALFLIMSALLEYVRLGFGGPTAELEEGLARLYSSLKDYPSNVG